jgi:hypothetical protein
MKFYDCKHQNEYMIKPIILAIVILFFSACTKEEIKIPPASHPVMHYTNLQNAEVVPFQPRAVDIDSDGINDFLFGVLLVGDPILQRDRLQYLAYSKVSTNLLNNEQDQSPVLNKEDLISATHQGYQWFEISAIVLAEKITTMTDSFWEGLWKNASHKYLPVQLKKNDKLYHGWIELSFDMVGGKLFMHKAAVSTEANKTIKAGF